MNSTAYSRGIYIIFWSPPLLSSPNILSFSSSNFRLTIKVFPSIFLILTNSKSLFIFFLSVVKLAWTSFDTTFLLGLLEPSLIMKGKLAIFLMTYFCFFHSNFNFQASYSDFLSCNLFKNLEFSLSILQVCFLRNEQLRLLFILSISCSLGDFFLILWVIFQRRYLFSRYIQVILSSSIRFFFYWFKLGCPVVHYHPVELGLICRILSKCFQRFRSYYLLKSTSLPFPKAPLIIIITIIIVENHQSQFLMAYWMQLAYFLEPSLTFGMVASLFFRPLPHLELYFSSFSKVTRMAMLRKRLWSSQWFKLMDRICSAYCADFTFFFISSMKIAGCTNCSSCLLYFVLMVRALRPRRARIAMMRTPYYRYVSSKLQNI